MESKLEFTGEELKIIEEYMDNNMKKLKYVSMPIIKRKGVAQMEHDELFSVAIDTLMKCVKKFDSNRECTFNTYFVNILKRKLYDWTRDRTRSIRCNVLIKNGKIVTDENSKPIILKNISLDASVDTWNNSEHIASKFDVFNFLFKEEEMSDKTKEYFNTLTTRQKKIALYLYDGDDAETIMEELGLTKREYKNEIDLMRTHEREEILF